MCPIASCVDVRGLLCYYSACKLKIPLIDLERKSGIIAKNYSDVLASKVGQLVNF